MTDVIWQVQINPTTFEDYAPEISMQLETAYQAYKANKDEITNRKVEIVLADKRLAIIKFNSDVNAISGWPHIQYYKDNRSDIKKVRRLLRAPVTAAVVTAPILAKKRKTSPGASVAAVGLNVPAVGLNVPAVGLNVGSEPKKRKTAAKSVAAVGTSNAFVGTSNAVTKKRKNASVAETKKRAKSATTATMKSDATSRSATTATMKSAATANDSEKRKSVSAMANVRKKTVAFTTVADGEGAKAEGEGAKAEGEGADGEGAEGEGDFEEHFLGKSNLLTYYVPKTTQHVDDCNVVAEIIAAKWEMSKQDYF